MDLHTLRESDEILAERIAERDEVREPDVDLAALDAAEVADVEAGATRDRALCQAGGLSELAQSET